MVGWRGTAFAENKERPTPDNPATKTVISSLSLSPHISHVT
ncbi:hypothetical protein RE6C_02991 [Rhodopirellula europaea 6C]|uniref:Uncharacterized protein n=1 Tax=Rhodopirellula europaea 6C TaxID=1263867 RepID=M2B3D8_9BACT|nr:hypothetical protein RE6C_02991 [Rhodopirellula europaea 6C]